MSKQLVFGSIFFSLLMLLLNFNSIAFSHDVQSDKLVFIEMNRYQQNHIETIYTPLTLVEVDAVKHTLTTLSSALETRDYKKIQECEQFLHEKGIFGNHNIHIPTISTLHPHSPIISKQMSADHPLHRQLRSDNISNMFCYLHAQGNGLMIFSLGVFLLFPTLLLMSIFGANVLLLLLPLYMVILIATHLVPFRIGLPIATLHMKEGSIGTLGLQGNKKIEVTNESRRQLTIGGFSGITINIPGEGKLGGFLFVSGFALIVEGTDQ